MCLLLLLHPLLSAENSGLSKDELLSASLFFNSASKDAVHAAEMDALSLT